jgi:hypothetical protein
MFFPFPALPARNPFYFGPVSNQAFPGLGGGEKAAALRTTLASLDEKVMRLLFFGCKSASRRRE